MIVLDPPEAIQQLRNRQSMLQDVAQLNLCDCGGVSFLFSHSNNVELLFSDQSHFWFLHHRFKLQNFWKHDALTDHHHKIPGHVDVPRQLVITGDAASIPSSVAKAGLKLPLGMVFSSATLYGLQVIYFLLSIFVDVIQR